MLNVRNTISKLGESDQQIPSTNRTRSGKLFSRQSAPTTMTVNPPAQRPIDNRQIQESEGEYSHSPEISPVKSINHIRNIGKSSRQRREGASSFQRNSQRLSIGLKRSTANKWLISIFCYLLVILLWAHFWVDGKSDVFRHLEDTAAKNNGSVPLGEFRNIMFEKERVTDTEWDCFLDEVQNDQRLQYIRNEKGQGILKFDY